MKLKLTMLALLFIGAGTLSAQKLKQNGDLSFLKGQDKVNVEFTYDNLVIGKKDRMAEQAYIDKSMAEREAAKAGDGQRWLDGWNAARESYYHPSFLELINKVLKGEGVEFGDFPDAQYTLVFDVLMMEPGWNIGIMKQAAELDGVAYFYETANRGEALADVSITAAPGSQYGGYDFDVASRLKESFAISGKRLGALLKKKAY